MSLSLLHQTAPSSSVNNPFFSFFLLWTAVYPSIEGILLNFLNILPLFFAFNFSASVIISLHLQQTGSDVCLRSAAIGDVLELSYQVRLLDQQTKGGGGERGLVLDGAKTIAAEGEYSWLEKSRLDRTALTKYQT